MVPPVGSGPHVLGFPEAGAATEAEATTGARAGVCINDTSRLGFGKGEMASAFGALGPGSFSLCFFLTGVTSASRHCLDVRVVDALELELLVVCVRSRREGGEGVSGMMVSCLSLARVPLLVMLGVGVSGSTLHFPCVGGSAGAGIVPVLGGGVCGRAVRPSFRKAVGPEFRLFVAWSTAPPSSSSASSASRLPSVPAWVGAGDEARS